VYGDNADGSGSPTADLIYAQSGADTVHGGGGDDYIEGNAGADTINGNNGNDHIVGGSGVDNGGASGAVRELADSIDVGDVIH
jgi:Ca2+-binding RTX toxin-like protein